MSKLPPLRNDADNTRSATTNLEQESTRASFAPSRNPQSRSDTSSRIHNHHASYDAGEDDERPLRYSRSSAASATTDTCHQPQHHTAQNKDRVSLGERLGEDVLCKSLIVPLIATSFVTGLLDASTYQLFATFASNQTGNVILLAVGASGIMVEHSTTLYNGISLAGYLVLGFIFGHLGNAAGPRRRWWLLTSHLSQLVLLACVLALTWTRTFPSTKAQWPLLLLLAMSSGIQVAQARTSGIQELPTAMLSSPMVDLVVDPNLWKLSLSDPSVQPRNRRAMHVAAMCSGAFAGAFLHKARGAEASILVACVIKFAITFALVFVKGEVREQPKDVEKAQGGERSCT